MRTPRVRARCALTTSVTPGAPSAPLATAGPFEPCLPVGPLGPYTAALYSPPHEVQVLMPQPTLREGQLPRPPGPPLPPKPPMTRLPPEPGTARARYDDAPLVKYVRTLIDPALPPLPFLPERPVGGWGDAAFASAAALAWWPPPTGPGEGGVGAGRVRPAGFAQSGQHKHDTWHTSVAAVAAGVASAGACTHRGVDARRGALLQHRGIAAAPVLCARHMPSERARRQRTAGRSARGSKP